MKVPHLTPEHGLLLLGILAGVGGFVAARGYLVSAQQSTARDYAQRYAPRKVLVAATALQAGDTLSASHVALRDMPQHFLPSSAVAAGDTDGVLDATLVAALMPGDPVQRNLLRRSPPSMASRLPTGYRAMTLAAAALGPIGDVLKSGDHIDLWIETTDPGGSQLSVVQPMPDITVFAVAEGPDDPQSMAGGRGEPSVTLLVSPSEAARIVNGLRGGGLAATLRASLEPPATKLPVVAPLRGRGAAARLKPSDTLELFAADGQSITRHLLSAGAWR